MKKYKLIKEYPGSPKLGVIAYRRTSVTKDPYYCISLTENVDGQCILVSVESIENYPEFWELIVEKDYEVIAYQHVGFQIWDKCGDDLFRGRENLLHKGLFSIYHPEDYFKKSCFTIHSIKRLSDGEIFTIGDVVIDYNLGMKQGDRIISIRKIGNAIAINGQKFQSSLESIQKAKVSLFTTEDGVDIFEGNRFYYIVSGDIKFERGIGSLIAEPNVIAQCALARFSTKEAAEEYILMNKPVLSINDIFKLNESGKLAENSFYYENDIKLLKELVKSKL